MFNILVELVLPVPSLPIAMALSPLSAVFLIDSYPGGGEIRNTPQDDFLG
jgi:hypothetical protein